MQTYQAIIEQYFAKKEELSPQNAPIELKECLDIVFQHLNDGKWRICEKINSKWVTNTWLKEAILLSFRIYPNQVMQGGFSNFFDKLTNILQNKKSK